MLRSMTAYGWHSQQLESGEYVCELRSVNSRYLDVSIRLPEALRSLESEFKELLSKQINRGKVEVTLKHVEANISTQAITINDVLLSRLKEATSHISQLIDGSTYVDVVRLLQWPGVICVSEEIQVRQAQDATRVFNEALNDFLAHRHREGQAIEKLLEDKAIVFDQYIEALRVRRPEVVAKQREKWHSKLATLGVDLDEQRIEQEIVLLAQKLDIDEELDRLSVHVVELSKALQRDDPVGRRLDFLMQEFNREANTASSKSADAISTGITVDMKVLIEQMREQVQNIE